MRREKSWMFGPLTLACALSLNAWAIQKKPAAPATATSAKTAKVLVSRLTAPRVEEPKTKKNAANPVAAVKLKESSKPVAVAKLGNQEKLAANSKTVARTNLKAAEKAQPTGKKGLLANSKSPKLKESTASRTSAPVKGKLVNSKTLALADSEQKGKFGRDHRTKREEPEPVKQPVKTTRDIAAVEPSPTRRVRPRIAEPDDDTSSARGNEVKETPRLPEQERITEAPKMPIASPDRIEVVEPTSPQLSKLLALPNSRPSAPYGAIVTRGATPTLRKDVNIPQQRIFEIQYELSKRGFYTAEPNGIYDEITVSAMWEFQKNYGLPATGYPTAHSLKRLGLTAW